jgi:hypothetical protein
MSSAGRLPAWGESSLLLVAVLIVMVVAGAYIYAAVVIVRYSSIAKDFGWGYVRRGDGVYVSEVNSQGPASGLLQGGDRIVGVNGDERIRKGGLRIRLAAIPPDDFYTISIRRDSEERTFKLPVPLKRDYNKLLTIIIALCVSVIFYLAALLIGWRKPREKIAQLACIALLVEALHVLSRALDFTRDFFPGETAASLVEAAVFPLQYAVAYHFYYRFPEGAPRGRFWSFLQSFIYISCALVYVTGLPGIPIVLSGAEVAINYYSNFPAPFKFVNLISGWVLVPLWLSSICAVIIRNYLVVKDPDQRIRVKYIAYSSAVVFALLSAQYVLREFFSGYINLWNVDALQSFEDALAISLILIPIATSVAIIKHRVFDINIVVRLTLQRLLAKSVLWTFLSFCVLGLAYTLYSNRNRTIKDTFLRNSIFFYLLSIAALSIIIFRKRIIVWIDKKFYREHYNREKILWELGDKVLRLESASDISGLVGAEVDAALHPEGIYLFYRAAEKGDMFPAYASDGRTSGLRIPSDFSVLSYMEYHGSAQEFPFPPENNLPRGERDWLARVEPDLIVPMINSEQRLTGLLLLGKKRSEERYTPKDKELLVRLTRQMAHYYETLSLKDRRDAGLYSDAAEASKVARSGSASGPMTKRHQVFISYSHKDRKWLEALRTHLKPLVRNSEITVWDDSMIMPGEKWAEEIKRALASATVAVLMVTPDFLASDFIAEHELLPLLKASRKEGLKVLWIAVKPSMYGETEIAGYQALNDPEKPLSRLNGADRDRELVRICEEIKSAVSR